MSDGIGGLPPELALELALSKRLAKDTCRDPAADPGDGPGHSVVRCAPRIHGELLKFGIDVAQSTIAESMARHGRGCSPTWKTFLSNHAAGFGGMGFLIMPTIGFHFLIVLIILQYWRRHLISLSVTDHSTAGWTGMSARA